MEGLEATQEWFGNWPKCRQVMKEGLKPNILFTLTFSGYFEQLWPMTLLKQSIFYGFSL